MDCGNQPRAPSPPLPAPYTKRFEFCAVPFNCRHVLPLARKAVFPAFHRSQTHVLREILVDDDCVASCRNDDCGLNRSLRILAADLLTLWRAGVPRACPPFLRHGDDLLARGGTRQVTFRHATLPFSANTAASLLRAETRASWSSIGLADKTFLGACDGPRSSLWKPTPPCTTHGPDDHGRSPPLGHFWGRAFSRPAPRFSLRANSDTGRYARCLANTPPARPACYTIISIAAE